MWVFFLEKVKHLVFLSKLVGDQKFQFLVVIHEMIYLTLTMLSHGQKFLIFNNNKIKNTLLVYMYPPVYGYLWNNR